MRDTLLRVDMRVAFVCGVLFGLSALLGCEDRTAARDPAIRYLSSTEQLARASMAIRGIRPSRLDLLTVAEDPAQLPLLVDLYLGSPELGATMRELHNESLRVKTQQVNLVPPALGPLAEHSFHEIAAAIFDEPLRLIEYIVVNDRPYTEVVTADYTMANPLVASAWGLAHSGKDRWEPAKWTDDRGAGGVLATNALHLRYRSAAYNFHRGRANTISRGLLCHDFLDGEIHLDTRINLADPAVVGHALVENPSCAGCHQTLDPLASYFFGFRMGPVVIGEYPFPLFFAEREAWWEVTTARPPGYFGLAPQGLGGLGKAIAADPRFARCAVQRFASYLTETPMQQLPVAWVAALQEDFVASGYSAKQLIKDIVLSPRFAVAAHREMGPAETLVGYQKVRPQQLGRMIAELTGYEWKDGEIDLLDDDVLGFRVLAGGIDSFYVTEPVHTMNATSSLVTRALAMAAATHVVDHDLTSRRRQLFAEGSLTSTREADVRRQLARLRARIYSELIDEGSPRLADELALFRGVLDEGGDARRAWILTVAAMLGDLRAVYY